MTDDFEGRLSLQLRERVPDPPHVCTAQDVWDRSSAARVSRRASTLRVSAVVAAVALVGVVATTVSLRGSTPSTQVNRHPNTSSASSTSSLAPGIVTAPRALVGPTWRLVTFLPAHGSEVHANPKSAPTINFAANGAIEDNSCNVAEGSLSAGRIVFHQPVMNGLVAEPCGPRSSITLSDALDNALGTGALTWSIRESALTIRRADVGVLVFRGIPADATIYGQLVVVGGPAPGTQRPTSGSITLREVSGSVPVRVKTDSKGRFSTAVTPGRWSVTGQSPRLRSLVCESPGHVAVSSQHTTHVRVICSIR